MRAKRISQFIIFLGIILILAPPAVSQQSGSRGPEGDIDDWTIIESSYATIYVDKDVDVRRVSRQINVGFARYDPIEKELFLNRGISDEERLANKIDIIVRKAKKILDMNPPGLHINIRVYETQKDLWDAYEDIFNEKKKHIAFYIHKYRTIYIPVRNVSESVLAHEIGHTIIDNYFAILPPPRIRELLASYVDLHLKD